jgi:outer membrane protein insertion porin family
MLGGALKRWLAVALLWPALALADTFTVTDIRIQGLQRVSAGTVFNLLPVNVGDAVDEAAIRQLIRLLFQSGYFRDVKLTRDGDALIVTVVERPAIDSIELKGNKSIKTDALMEGLGKQGLKEGEIFKQSTLERVDLELSRQYVAQGRYGASIETKVEELPRNRVAIHINIKEGKTSTIEHINVVGNHAFPEPVLLDVFELKTPSLLSFLKNDDKYSKEKLKGDLEKLESYYKDRGYVTFNVDSTQVSITPDKRHVYLTVNVTEGGVYKIDKVELVGELHDVSPDALRSLLLVEPGQVFSGALVTASEERLTQALGNSGYTFASASGVPQVHDNGTVDVRFMVEAGKRAYVRRIEFKGNSVTHDEVLRREMRQMEGGWASTALIELSKTRLERLGFFKDVNVETPEAAGTDDQVDVKFSVEEQPSGSISATLGYAQASGLIVGAGYQESNVLGTGNSMSLNVSWSQFQRAVAFNYFNPYFTLDGISRGYNLYFRQTDFQQQNIATYSTDAYGAGVNFSFPIGETQRIGFGLTADHTKLKTGYYAAQEITEFIAEEGDTFLNYLASLSWSSSTLNRGLFPTRGRSQSVTLQLSTPLSDLTFYKLDYKDQVYFPLSDGYAVRLHGELGYGDSYGGGGGYGLPFYQNFFAGGFGTVRGFKQNTLGPLATPSLYDPYTKKGQPIGGNTLVLAGAELIFPMPFVKDGRSMRPVMFIDSGNVFNSNCPSVSTVCDQVDLNLLRYSVGFSLTWITGMGPMTFGIAKAFNYSNSDQTEFFQFELGRTF